MARQHACALNASAFYYDYTDLQVSVFASLGNITTTFTTNAAEATVQGLELELQARPVANLDLAASISYLDATYDEFVTPYGTCTVANAAADPALRRPSRPAAPDRRERQPAEQRARDQGHAVRGLRHRPRLRRSRVAVRAGLAPGPGVLPAGQHRRDVAEGLVRWSMRAWRTLPRAAALEVSAFGKNLGDEDYFHNIVQFTSTSDARRDPFNIGNALGYAAPGRQWGVELTYRFGN